MRNLNFIFHKYSRKYLKILTQIGILILSPSEGGKTTVTNYLSGIELEVDVLEELLRKFDDSDYDNLINLNLVKDKTADHKQISQRGTEKKR